MIVAQRNSNSAVTYESADNKWARSHWVRAFQSKERDNRHFLPVKTLNDVCSCSPHFFFLGSTFVLLELIIRCDHWRRKSKETPGTNSKVSSMSKWAVVNKVKDSAWCCYSCSPDIYIYMYVFMLDAYLCGNLPFSQSLCSISAYFVKNLLCNINVAVRDFLQSEVLALHVDQSVGYFVSLLHAEVLHLATHSP